MGSYSRFEHYSMTLEVETCPEFWPHSSFSGPLCAAKHREVRRRAVAQETGVRDRQSSLIQCSKRRIGPANRFSFEKGSVRSV